MISILERKGMVKLQPSKTDQRCVYVPLTQKCFDYFDSKENVGNKLNTVFFGILSVETEAVAALLGYILQNAQAALKEEAI